SPGRTRRYAGLTAPAMGRCRLIQRQGQVGEYLSQEEPRPGVARNEVGVLADPSQPGIAGQCFLKYRRGVDADAVAEGTDLHTDVFGQACKGTAHYLVIVASECIP